MRNGMEIKDEAEIEVKNMAQQMFRSAVRRKIERFHAISVVIP